MVNLTVKNGKVKYLMIQGDGVVGNDLTPDAAMRMMSQGTASSSAEHDGYGIKVEMNGGAVFFLAGKCDDGEVKRKRVAKK